MSGGRGADRPAGVRASAIYLEEVEALRGWAIVLVVASHFSPWIHAGEPSGSVSALHAFLISGHTGVSLFFILSGFLLSEPFLAEAAGGRGVRLSNFYWRRTLRILPLYYFAVGVAFLLSLRDLTRPARYLAYPFFLQGLPGVPAMMPYSNVWWSLCTEVQFYLLLPLLPWLYRTWLGRRVAMIAALIYAAALGATLLGRLPWGRPPFLDSHALYGRLPLFAFGIACAAVYRGYGERFRRWARASAVLRNGGSDAILVAVLFVLGVVLQQVNSMGYFVAEQLRPIWHLYEGALWTLVLWLLLTTPLRSRRLWSNRVLQRLGVLSYSIYMIHYPLIEPAWNLMCRDQPLACRGWNARTLATFAGLATAIFLLSTVTYVLIERPFLRRKSRAEQ